MMIGSAFPFFRQLRDITPKAMLANTTSSGSKFTLRKILPYLPIPLIIAAFLYLLTDRISLVLWSVGGLFTIFGLCMAIAYLLIRFSHRIRSRF